MKTEGEFYDEVARLICRASELESTGREGEAAHLRARVESACIAMERRIEPIPAGDSALPRTEEERQEYLAEAIVMLCRSEFLGRRGEREAAEDYRLLAEACFLEFEDRAA